MIEETNDGKKGGKLSGLSHKQGGIKAIVTDTGRAVELESEEVIINKKTVNSTDKFNFQGKEMTAKQILSELNSHKGYGVPIMEKGGEVENRVKVCPFYQMEQGGEIKSDEINLKEFYEFYGANEMDAMDSQIRMFFTAEQRKQIPPFCITSYDNLPLTKEYSESDILKNKIKDYLNHKNKIEVYNNPIPHSKNESFNFAGHEFYIARAYELIKNNEIPFEKKEIKPFVPELTRIDTENLSKFDNFDYKNTPIGIMIWSDKYETNLLIDGNHRMQYAYNKGIDKVKVYYIKDQKAIKKFYDSPYSDDIMFEKGGEIQDKDKIYKEWKNLVNMSASELRTFYDSKDGKEAGLSKSEASKLGIRSGRESAEWIMKMKETNKEDWTETMWNWAKRQINFIKRMSGNKGGLYDDKGNKTRKHTSLLIWGHNPEKFEGGGQFEIPDEIIDKSKGVYYFLRFTNNPKEDLERGTSIHSGADGTKEDASKLFDCDINDIEWVNGSWCQKLDGLCGYELDAESLKDAIDEINEKGYQFEFVGNPVIFKGRFSNQNNEVPDGDLFKPLSISYIKPMNIVDSEQFKTGGSIPESELKAGIKVEHEHKDLYKEIEKRLAEKGQTMPMTEDEFYEYIASVHISERKDYYDLIEKYIENKAELMAKGGNVKDIYDSKREYAARKMEENAKAETLTEEQHEALANLCKVRHKLHTNMDKAVKSDDANIKKDIILANIQIDESKLNPMDFIPLDTSDYIDIDTIDLLYETEQVPEDDKEKQDWYDDNYYRIHNELEQLNKNIENYLFKIDNKHGTNYCPTGFSRIMNIGGNIEGLSDLQKSQIDKLKKDYQLQIIKKRNQLDVAKKSRDKKINEIYSRCGLFGDTKADPKQNSLFGNDLECTDKTYNDALKPYNDKIVLIREEIRNLESDLNKSIEAVYDQVEILFKKGGNIINNKTNITNMKATLDILKSLDLSKINDQQLVDDINYAINNFKGEFSDIEQENIELIYKIVKAKYPDSRLQKEKIKIEKTPEERKARMEKELKGLKVSLSTTKDKKRKIKLSKMIKGIELTLKISKFGGGGTINSLCPIGTKIQTLLVDKDVYSLKQAKSWLKDHGYKTSVDEKENTFRFRQIDPEKFKKDSFRTIELTTGIKGVIGCPVK